MAADDAKEAKEAPWTKEKEDKFRSKAHSKYYDPCQEAATRSLKCLQRNNGERSMCQDYFDAYRECKKEFLKQKQGFWS